MEADHVGDRQRPLGLKAKRIALLDLLEPALRGALHRLLRIDVLDRLHFLVGVARRVDCRIFALLRRRLALGKDANDAIDRDDLAALVDLDVAADADDSTAGDFSSAQRRAGKAGSSRDQT